MAPLIDDARVDVTVIGGGITGLAAAHRLIESAAGGPAPSIVVIEAADRPGGQIRTERLQGYLLEAGPDALVAQKPAAVALCRRIGLGGALRELRLPSAGTRILHRGRLHPVPDGFLMMAPTRIAPVLRSSLFSWRGKVRMLCEPFVPPRSADMDDESLSSFVRRRFGLEVLDRVAGPVIASLFTADAAQLSMRLAMGRFLDLEERHGSVTRGLLHAGAFARSRPFGHGTGTSGFVTVEGGLSRIVDALVAALPPGCVRTGTHVVAVSRSPIDHALVSELHDGRRIRSSAVLLACPGHEAARTLGALDPSLAASVSELRYASCATVNLAYPAGRLRSRLDGFGFFATRSEDLPILACSYVSAKFDDRAPEGMALFRVFLGGAENAAVLAHDDDELAHLSHDALARVLEIDGPPSFAKVYRADRAMPQFAVGGRATLDALQARAAEHPGLFLAGSLAGAFGLPDCIGSGEAAADRVVAFLSERCDSALLADSVRHP